MVGECCQCWLPGRLPVAVGQDENDEHTERMGTALHVKQYKHS